MNIQPNFDKMCSFGNLLEAFRRAKRANNRSKPAQEFSWQLERNLLKLRDELLSGAYQHGGYYEFIVHDAKKRHIKAASFRDRVVHQLLCMAIEPVFEKLFIADSFACRKGKGTHQAVQRLEKWLRKDVSEYVLSCDISKYFDNVDHNVLLDVLDKHIKDKKILEICRLVLESGSESGKGIPIGNLTSQLFANVYLNQFDQFIKRTLSITAYVRYMDDFLILGVKEDLHIYKAKIQQFLSEKLFLELHPKKANIFPVKKGVPYLGYTVFKFHRRLRTSTVKRFLRRYKDKSAGGDTTEDDTLHSWLAWANTAKTRGLIRNLRERQILK